MTRLMSTLAFRDVTFVSGAGAKLYTDNGEDYIDFFCDVGTSSLGYNPPEMKHALERMLEQNIPAHAPNLYGFEERNRAADRLCAATGMDKVFFCNSGAEAVEGAIKLARLHKWKSGLGGATKVFSYKGGFHGRTYAGMAAGDGPVYHRQGFGGLPPDFHHFERIEDIHRDTAAIILSPVFGNNDVIEYPRGWLMALRRHATEIGAVLIFDEVQTGSGRTGLHTYNQSLGGIADIITLAKGVAMGAPVGAVLAREPYASTFTPGSHFSTFGGNPISMVFVNGMLDWLGRNLGVVERTGEYIRNAFHGLANVRGPGMLLAFDTQLDSLALAKACLEERVLIGAFRPGPGPIKITPPLNIRRDVLDDGLGRLMRGIRRVTNGEISQ